MDSSRKFQDDDKPSSYDYLLFSFTNPPLLLPVVFTLITEEEVGEQLRQRVEVELLQIGAELSVTIQIEQVERFGELTCKY